MPNPTTEARLIAIVAETLGIEADRITTDQSLFTDLGADSLDLVEVVMALEEAFGFEIRDDDMERMRTVADLLALIPAKSEQVAPASGGMLVRLSDVPARQIRVSETIGTTNEGAVVRLTDQPASQVRVSDPDAQ